MANFFAHAAASSLPEVRRAVSNAVHQADLLFMLHDRVEQKVFKYTLTVVDIASRFKEAEPLVSRTHGTAIRGGLPEVHRDQGIVEQLNRFLAERLFDHKYAVEVRLPTGQRVRMWAQKLPRVVANLNRRVTRLTGKSPRTRSRNGLSARPKKAISADAEVRYLFQPGELEGGVRRATDPIGTLETFELDRAIIKRGQPVSYWLQSGTKRSFVHKELMVVPPNNVLPPTTPG